MKLGFAIRQSHRRLIVAVTLSILGSAAVGFISDWLVLLTLSPIGFRWLKEISIVTYSWLPKGPLVCRESALGPMSVPIEWVPGLGHLFDRSQPWFNFVAPYANTWLGWIVHPLLHPVLSAAAIYTWVRFGVPKRFSSVEDAGGSALFLRVAITSSILSFPIAAIVVAISFVLVRWHNTGLTTNWFVFSRSSGSHSVQELSQHFAGFLLYLVVVLLVARSYVLSRVVQDAEPTRACVGCGYPCDVNAICPECGRRNDGRMSRVLYLTRAHMWLAASRFWIVFKLIAALGFAAMLFAPLTHGLWAVVLMMLGLRSNWIG